MNGQIWLVMLTIIGGLLTCFIGILVAAMFKWRDEIKKDLMEFRNTIMDEINKIVGQNEMAHSELWERINHHAHTEEGLIIIPKRGG
jgi:hypothetical protein